MSFIDWLFRRRRDDDLQDEIQAHLSMAIKDRVSDGQDPESARLAAMKEFGNVTLAREDARLSWGGAWRAIAGDLGQDVRYAIRALGRSPGYVLIVTVVLALGIGANASLFGLFRAVALKPLPGVDGSARLAVLTTKTNGGSTLPLSHPDFRDLVEQQRSFTALAGTTLEMFSLGLGSRGERVWTEIVTGNYFQTLGVGVQRGRMLLPSDDVTPGQHPWIVISDGLWKRAFGSDPDIIGKKVVLSGYPLTIVGVTEPAFHGSIVSVDVEVFAPIMMQPQLRLADRLSARGSPMLWGLGHLKPGVTIAEAAAEADVISARLIELHPEADAKRRAIVIPMWESPYGAQTYVLPAIMLLGLMGVLLLLIVCANVANLVLVRGVSRRGEIAARLALGAKRSRVLRLLFIESLVLTVPGALAGVVVAQALHLINRSGPVGPVGRVYLDVSTDGLVVAFALVLACGSALIFGFLPALRISRVDLGSIMKDDLSPRTGSKGRARTVLVVSQVAVSLMLLVGAGLVMRSLESARNADPGFDARNIISLSLDPRSSGYGDNQVRTLYRNLLDALQAEPGIESVTLASSTPLSLVPGSTREFEIGGYARRKNEDLQYSINSVAPGYFSMLRIPMLAGRDFNRSDDANSQGVAIINETFARRYWQTPANAIGQPLRIAGGEWRSVAGVVRDIKYARLDEEPRPFVYMPFEQYTTLSLFVHVRGNDAPAALIERSRSRIQAMDANLPVLDARSLRQQTQAGLSIIEMAANILIVFGAISAILAAIGTYGMLSYSARQSEHEIGIRMAIGADRADVLRRFLGRGLRVGAMGAALGLMASVAVARVLASLLYGVSATDIVSIASAFGVMLGVVCTASLVPAWRASRTDPIAALRHR